MKILCIATKSPWPPNDGGRLALWLSLQGLADAGHTVRLIAPVPAPPNADTLAALRRVCDPVLVTALPHPWPAALRDALLRNTALTVARHTHAAVRDAVAAALQTFGPDVVHVEQLQALAHATPAQAAGVPVVLRMQNVESALWRQVGAARLHLRPLRVEAARLRRDEAAALASCARTVTLTERDAEALRSIAPDAPSIVAVSPPFPATLDAGAPLAAHQTAAPARIAQTIVPLALAGSAGWWPNRDGTRWFLTNVAPLLRDHVPDARLHVFGGERVQRDDVTWHAAPDDARDAFPADAIALVPLHVASGIRMRILDACARGLPVIATSTAAAGLAATHGQELLVADTPQAMLDAITALVHDTALRQRLIAAGRSYLSTRHDPQRQTDALVAVYDAASRTTASR